MCKDVVHLLILLARTLEGGANERTRVEICPARASGCKGPRAQLERVSRIRASTHSPQSGTIDDAPLLLTLSQSTLDQESVVS